MIKNIAKLGIIGLLSASLAGCATVSNITTVTRRFYGQPVEHEIKRKKVSSKITYFIGDARQEGCKISVPITESKEDMIEVTTEVSRDVYEGEQWMGGLSSNERKVDTETHTLSKRINEKIYENQPAKDASVKFEGMLFGLGDGKLTSEKLTRTNSEGIASVEIAALPEFEYFDEANKKRYIQFLKRGMKKSLIQRINLDTILDVDIETEHIVGVETKAKRDVFLNSEDNLEFVDAEKRVYILGKRIDPSNLFSYIGGLIKDELKNKYLLRPVAVQVVKEDLMPSEAEIELRAVKTLSPSEVSMAIEKIKENYLVKGEKLYEQVKIDPSCVISNLDSQKLYVPAGGLEILVNVPSEYDITVAKEGYIPAEKKVVFTKAMKGKLPVKLYRLGTPITIGTGKSTIDVE